MKLWLALGLALAAARAQTPAMSDEKPPEAEKGKPPSSSPALGKPTPREKARQLLDGAAGMAGAAQPEVQAPALMHLADNYRELDRKKALAYFQQAFAATAILPATLENDDRSEIQARIAGMAADLDEAAAVAMLRQIALAGKADPRTRVLDKLVDLMVAPSKFDDALALVETLGATGNYPYQAMSRIPRLTTTATWPRPPRGSSAWMPKPC